MMLLDLTLLMIFIAMAKVLGGKTLAAGRADAAGAPFYFELGIGFAVISYAMFLLGVTVGFNANYFKAVSAVLLVLWRKDVLRALREGAATFGGLAEERAGWFDRFLLALLLVCVLFCLFFNYAPPTGEDELVYHLNVPLKYLLHGRMYAMPENSPAYYFLTLDLLYIPLMAVKSALAAKLLSFAFGLFDMALVYQLTREFVGRRYALLAAATFYTTPMAVGLAGVGKIDAGVTFYTLLALWSFLKYSRAELKDEKPWFVLFTLSSGIMTASKSSGPFLAAALMIMLAAVLIRKKKGLYGAAGPLFAYGLTAALFVAPWLIKNMLWAGNPLYPAKIFPGLPYEEKFYYIMQIYNLKPQSAIIRDYFFGILMGTGYVIAAFMPLYFIVKNKNAAINALLAFSGLLISILYISGYAADLARYTYCCYAVFAVAGAYAIITLSESEPQLRRIIRVFVLLMLLAPGVCMSVYFGARRLPYILGLRSADQYLQQQYEWEGWDVVKWVRANVPASERLFFLGEVDTIAYYYDQTMYAGNCPTILRYRLKEAKAYLKDRHIGYVIVCRNRYKETNGVLYHTLPFMNVYWFEGTSIGREFVLVYEKDGTRVYKVPAG